MKNIKQRVLDNIDQEKVVNTLADLLSIPSYVDLTKGSHEWEKPKVDYLEERLKEIGLDYVIAGEFDYGRPTLIAFLRGSDRKVKVGFHAHMDTHSPLDSRLYKPGGTPRHPNCATVKNGKIFGLGAGDSIPPIAAFLGAAEAIKKSNVKLGSDAIAVWVPAAMESGRGGQVAADWMLANNVKPEFIISGEPNGSDISIAQWAILAFEIEITGVAAFHASKIQQEMVAGSGNAMERMIEVAQALKEMVAQENRFKYKNSLGMSSLMTFSPSFAGSRFAGTGSAIAPYQPTKPGQRTYQAVNNIGRFAPHIMPEVARLRFEFHLLPRDRKSDELFHMECATGHSREEMEEMINRHLQKLWQKSPSRCTYELKCVRDFGVPYEISRRSHMLGL